MPAVGGSVCFLQPIFKAFSGLFFLHASSVSPPPSQRRAPSNSAPSAAPLPALLAAHSHDVEAAILSCNAFNSFLFPAACYIGLCLCLFLCTRIRISKSQRRAEDLGAPCCRQRYVQQLPVKLSCSPFTSVMFCSDSSRSHQADVSHSYHVLVSRGIPPSQIVVMMYDDIVRPRPPLQRHRSQSSHNTRAGSQPGEPAQGNHRERGAWSARICN